MAGVAFLVGVFSAGFELFMSGVLLREQMAKRGRYIAQNLAYNSKYGVLTEDKPLLTQLLEGALSSGTDRARGGDQRRGGRHDPRRQGGGAGPARGAVIRDLPAHARPRPSRSATPSPSRARAVILFRAPVTSDSGGGMAAELGLAAEGGARPAEELKGGVEVAISKSVMAAQQRKNFLSTSSSPSSSSPAGSGAGWCPDRQAGSSPSAAC